MTKESFDEWARAAGSSGIWAEYDLEAVKSNVNHEIDKYLGPGNTAAEILSGSKKTITSETGYQRVDGEGWSLFSYGDNAAVLTVTQSGTTPELDALEAKSPVVYGDAAEQPVKDEKADDAKAQSGALGYRFLEENGVEIRYDLKKPNAESSSSEKQDVQSDKEDPWNAVFTFTFKAENEIDVAFDPKLGDAAGNDIEEKTTSGQDAEKGGFIFSYKITLGEQPAIEETETQETSGEQGVSSDEFALQDAEKGDFIFSYKITWGEQPAIEETETQETSGEQGVSSDEFALQDAEKGDFIFSYKITWGEQPVIEEVETRETSGEQGVFSCEFALVPKYNQDTTDISATAETNQETLDSGFAAGDLLDAIAAYEAEYGSEKDTENPGEDVWSGVFEFAFEDGYCTQVWHGQGSKTAEKEPGLTLDISSLKMYNAAETEAEVKKNAQQTEGVSGTFAFEYVVLKTENGALAGNFTFDSTGIINSRSTEKDNSEASVLSMPPDTDWPDAVAKPEKGDVTSVCRGGETTQLVIENTSEETVRQWMDDLTGSGLWVQGSAAEIASAVREAAEKDLGSDAQTVPADIDFSGLETGINMGYRRNDDRGYLWFFVDFGAKKITMTVTQTETGPAADTQAFQASGLAEGPVTSGLYIPEGETWLDNVELPKQGIVQVSDLADSFAGYADMNEQEVMNYFSLFAGMSVSDIRAFFEDLESRGYSMEVMQAFGYLLMKEGLPVPAKYVNTSGSGGN